MKVDWSEAFALRRQGKTFKEIAELVGASEGYVRAKLAGVGKGESAVADEIRESIKRLSKELSDISAKL